MARYTGPSCRLCRREGMKLYLKGTRCETAKCAMERQWRNQPPGQHGLSHGKPSEYAVRLREKQKLRRYYGVLERQFRRTFSEAAKETNTGEALLTLMERRLDNVVYRLGFAPSRPAARQMVCHGHFLLNGKRVTISSITVKSGDVIKLRDREATKKLVEANRQLSSGRTPPQWLTLDEATLEATVAALPTREDVSIQIDEQLIVEFCSR
ncbi:MAG TPA: 30S ribosomal protein S4 [Phycisphaerae bacterium]|nr:30S ribosomal protein S4 [Phycisphaerae bacterium]HOI54043.1 30S ribosomal protein S4 [Phycisphaerae bacterium]